MNHRTLFVGLIAAAIMLATSARSNGQTIIIDPRPMPPRPHPHPHPHPPRPPIPPRPPRPPQRHMPLEVKKHQVEVSIIDGVSVTGVDQVFFNPHNFTVEGTYIFPLDDDVALSRFTMFVNGREIEGQLLTVEEARRTYESIVARMRDPALLEYLGTRMFQARIFPINPKTDVRIRLSYTQMLTIDDGLARYRYPLKAERHTGKPVDTVSVLVNLESKVAVKSVFSPTHKIAVSRPSDYRASASYEGRNVYPDKNFELYYALSDKEFGLTVLTHRQLGRDGFFLVRIAPPAKARDGDVLPKDIAFVIDTSGSMAGEKMTQAKEALKFCLANLNPSDRFNIIPFSHEAIRFCPEPALAAPETVSEARRFVDGLSATGGTNINDAVLSALEAAPAADTGRPYLIVFVTDGLPTIGVTEPDEILRNVAAKNTARVRLFAFGVGHDVNTRLLDLMAEQNRGTRDYVEPGEDLELKLSSFYRKVSNPVLADLSLTFGGLSVWDRFPPQLGDLFSGTELVVVGRYAGDGPKALELTGTRRGQSERFIYETTFPPENRKNEFLPRLWATRKVGYLLDEMRLHGESRELKDTIIELATRYGIVTPYTAMLVTEPGSVAHQRRGGRGNVMLDAFTAAEAPPPHAKGGKRGGGARRGEALRSLHGRLAGLERAPAPQAAVAKSKGAMGLRDAENVDETLWTLAGEPTAAPVSYVGARTFYSVGEKWVDAEYDKTEETTKVESFSERYFELVRKHPELAKCFALGERVIVVVAGTAYETVPPSDD